MVDIYRECLEEKKIGPFEKNCSHMDTHTHAHILFSVFPLNKKTKVDKKRKAVKDQCSNKFFFFF